VQKVQKVQKLSYKEKRELEEVPAQIEVLEKEQGKLSQELSDPDFFGGPRDEVRRVTDRLSELESQLAGLMERWEELEERSGGEQK
jgi:ATP-binding cassette subfamily F protein uup